MKDMIISYLKRNPSLIKAMFLVSVNVLGALKMKLFRI